MALRRTIAKLWSISMSSSCGEGVASINANKMLMLSESAVMQCLDMKSCLDVNRKALMGIYTGEATVPTRLGVPYYPPRSTTSSGAGTSDPPDWTLFKPASWARNPEPSSLSSVSQDTGVTESIGIKVVSVRSQNPSFGLPLVPATIFHVDAMTGIVDAIIAGTYATACRTAAGRYVFTKESHDSRKNFRSCLFLFLGLFHITVPVPWQPKCLFKLIARFRATRKTTITQRITQ